MNPATSTAPEKARLREKVSRGFRNVSIRTTNATPTEARSYHFHRSRSAVCSQVPLVFQLNQSAVEPPWASLRQASMMTIGSAITEA